MLRLVDVTDDGAGSVAASSRRVPADSAPALDALVDARLVARTGDEIDVVHEVVFRAWPQLASWLEEARADLTLDATCAPRARRGRRRDAPTTTSSAAPAAGRDRMGGGAAACRR